MRAELNRQAAELAAPGLQPIGRHEARREFRQIQTPYGSLTVKLKILNEEIIQAVPEGQSRSQSLSVNASLNLTSAAALSMAGGATTGPRFSWRRGLSFMVSYNLGQAKNNTEGAFTVPASNSLATEWGPSAGDVRHRANFAIYSGALKNLTASVNLSMSSAAPYTIRTGLDDNGDLIFNDRPAGVGRNTQRAAMQWYSYGYFTYAIGIGKRTVPLPPGITITSSGGALSIGTMAQPDAPRYRLLVSLSVQNLTNHANWVGYSGNMRSPFFLKPTGVDGVRTANLSVGFSF